MPATTPIHLVPGVDLGRLATHCLSCGAPLDLSHTHPSFRYATTDAVRSVIAAESAGALCPCQPAPTVARA